MEKKVCCGIMAVCMAALNLAAVMPKDTVTFEAESLKCKDNSWEKREHFPNWYDGAPSGECHLRGITAGNTPAVGKFEVKKRGKYNLWVRYLDLLNYRKNCGFIIVLRQNGKEIARKIFDENSLRSTSDGVKKWGPGWARFVWDNLSFDADAGAVELELSKLYAVGVTGSGGRHLDVFLITENLEYQPRIQDLRPLFIRVKMLDDNKTAGAIHIFGRRSTSFPGYYISHMNINKKGLFIGVDNGAGNMRSEYLAANDSSPWVEISPHLSWKNTDQLELRVMTNYWAAPPAESSFEVQLSSTPSEDGIFETFRRSGKGCAMLLNLNLRFNKYFSDDKASATSLEYASAAKAPEGKAPKKFPLGTGLSLSPQMVSDKTFDREVKALSMIGINNIPPVLLDEAQIKNFKFKSSNFFFHHAKGGCLSQPNLTEIDRLFQRFAEKHRSNGMLDNIVLLNLMDEPGLEINHVVKCPVCKNGFADYLKKMGLSVTGEPTADPAKGALFYWTVRYRNHLMTEYLRIGTKSAGKYMPQLPTTVNFANEIVYNGNMVQRGCDWYDILSSGALTYGWSEDWSNTCRTYQMNGFQCDVMRSAAGCGNVPFGMFDILVNRSAWEIQAKAFLLIGHGAKFIHFFNYGPYYAISSDTQSYRREIYSAIKSVAMPTGSAEDMLIGAKNAKGDAAMLFSVTSDIWNSANNYNAFGKERIYLNLLLRHCNIALDVLGEQELDRSLQNYSLLFAVDSHLKKEYAATIEKWVKSGGTLYVGAGALQFDENNQPLGLLEKLGIAPEKLTIRQIPGRGDHELINHKPLKTFKNMSLTVGMNSVLQKERRCGKGKVICIGFFPGLSYIGGTIRKNKDEYSILSWPSAHREFIASLALPIKPRLLSDDFLVEANLLEDHSGDVIVLSNWKGKETTVTLTLSNAGKYRSIVGAGVQVIDTRRNGDTLTVKVKTAAGGYVLCRK